MERARGAPRRGFTILEIIVATVIIAVAFIPVVSLMQASDRAYKKSDNNAVAYNLAMEALEWARSMPFDRLDPKYIDTPRDGFVIPVSLAGFRSPADPKNGVAPADIRYPDSFFKYFSNFTRRMKIETFHNDERMKLVEVLVTWDEPQHGGATSHREEVVRTVVVDSRPR